MRSVKKTTLKIFFCSLLALEFTSRQSLAAQVQVLLFGQPCQLVAPMSSFSEQNLKAIHQISPEQTPLSESPQSLKSSIDKLQSAQDLPQVFLKYREQRTRKLEAQLKFEESIIFAHKTGDSVRFSEATKTLIHPKRHAMLIKKIQAALKAGPSQRAWDELRIYFQDFSGPDGEEDFHRLLRRLKVQYQCSFEEGQNDGN